MLKFILYAFMFFVMAILQTVIVPHIKIMDAYPDLLLILTVITALRHGSLAGCFMGFMSGLLCDVYAPVEWLGAYSLAYCIVGFALGQIEESFINLNLFLKIVVLVLADFLKDIIYYFSIETITDDIPKIIYSLFLPKSIYTVVLGAIFFYLLSLKTEKKVEIYKQGL
ncbi:MAG: rod shape-determining protein MreD [Fibromonadales bacterium]|nr:rod shape-determining protein MreD [Fibromonadales bacterium]